MLDKTNTCIDNVHKMYYNNNEVSIMAMISVRTNEKLKEDASKIFDELGLDMSTAINMFLKRCVYCKGIPFDLKLEIPNKETLEAMQEVEDIKSGKLKGHEFTTLQDLIDDVDSEEI